jgi:hypothetical protein
VAREELDRRFQHADASPRRCEERRDAGRLTSTAPSVICLVLVDERSLVQDTGVAERWSPSSGIAFRNCSAGEQNIDRW